MTPDEILERACGDLFWVPSDTVIVERPTILYSISPRAGSPANAVHRSSATSERIPALVAEVRAAHEGVHSRWFVRPSHCSETLERCLSDAGYRPTYEHHAYVRCVEGYEPQPAAGITTRAVESLTELEACISVQDQACEKNTVIDPRRLREELAHCVGADRRVHRFVSYDDATGAPISSGSMTVHRSLRAAFLWGGGTLAQARGRGAYRAALSARVVRARELGLDRVGLYGLVDTSGPIVARVGFEKHGRMTHWDRQA